eukprot:4520974-Lingulodinium_polyedra.AAC.1
MLAPTEGLASKQRPVHALLPAVPCTVLPHCARARCGLGPEVTAEAEALHKKAHGGVRRATR